MGSQEGRLPSKSWYRPLVNTQQQVLPSTSDASVIPFAASRFPIPADRTIVVPDPFADILKENHSAQLATFEQQLELMRYLRRLNHWLERDAQDRTDELRGVFERIQRLRGIVHDIQLRESEDSTLSSSSSEGVDTTIRLDFPAVQAPMMQRDYPGFQPFPISRQQVLPAIPDRSTRPAPQPRVSQAAAQATIIILPTTQPIPWMAPIVPRGNHDRHALPGVRPTLQPTQPTPQLTSRVPSEEHIFVPPDTSWPSTESPRWTSNLSPQPVPPQNVVHIPQSSSSSRVSSSISSSNRGHREANRSRRRILHGSRERHGFRTRRSSSTSRGRRRLSRVPSIATGAVTPHIVNPPLPQPVIIAQQQVQPQPISRRHSTVVPHLSPLVQRQPTLTTLRPVQLAGTTSTVDSGPGMAEPGFTVPVPLAQRPAVVPVSDNIHPHTVPVATPAPVVVVRRDSPPRPRRSRLRKARHFAPTPRTQPIEPQPVIATTRSRSPSPHRRAPPLPMPIPVDTPESQPIPAPQVILMPASRPESLRSRRSLSDDSFVIIHATPRATTIQPESQVSVVQPSVVHPPTETHLVMHQRSRSHTPPIVLAPEELSSDSPRCRSYSTEDGGCRSSSPYYRYPRGYRPYGEGSSYSRSRSPSPLHRRFESPPSRTPSSTSSRVFCYTPTEVPPTDLLSPPRSIYYSRGSPHLTGTTTPAHVEVVNYPRGRSLSRRRTYPRHDEYQHRGRTATPESYRYTRGPDCSSISSPYSSRSIVPGYSDDDESSATLRRSTSVLRQVVPTPISPASEHTTDSSDWILLDEESGSHAVPMELSTRTRSMRPGQHHLVWKWIDNL